MMDRDTVKIIGEIFILTGIALLPTSVLSSVVFFGGGALLCR